MVGTLPRPPFGAEASKFPDFIRFAAVCSVWRLRRSRPPQRRLPLLISYEEEDGQFTFLDGVSTGVKLVGASDEAWRDFSVKILNPLTGALILLPPYHEILLRCFLSANPAAGDFMLAALPLPDISYPHGLYLYKSSSDKSWTNIQSPHHLSDLIFCNDGSVQNPRT